MIPGSIEIAVVEIVAADDTPLGTGFLVTPTGAILTARHVVDGVASVQVRFRGGEPIAATVGPTTDGQDWVLLTINEVPAGITPCAPGVVGNVARDVSWYTIAYPKLRANTRGSFHGAVRVASAQRLELYCTELDGKKYEDARGFSGSPCIVDGEVIALITSVTHNEDDQIVTGQVNAIPLEAIAQSGTALAVAGATRLPWQEVFTGAIEKLTDAERQIAAASARLANPVISDRLPGQIARRMINQGTWTTAEVLRQVRTSIPDAKVDEVMKVAETLWVDGLAADRLAAVVTSGQSAVLWTDQGWAAMHHLARAFASQNLGPKWWKSFVIEHEEPFLEVVVERAKAGLLAIPGMPKDRINERLDKEPVVAFVASIPDETVVAKLRQQWPKLVVVFLSRPAKPTTPPSIRGIEPSPSKVQEDLAQQDNTDALSHLSS